MEETQEYRLSDETHQLCEEAQHQPCNEASVNQVMKH